MDAGRVASPPFSCSTFAEELLASPKMISTSASTELPIRLARHRQSHLFHALLELAGRPLLVFPSLFQ